MKKLIIIPILLLSLSITAQTKWYVATTGSDTHGKGTLADPWLTIKHAADTITGAAFYGDTIVVGEGTFTEGSQIALGVEVNLKGAGATSIITTDAALNPIILLSSATENTNGNQTIFDLAFDGDSLALIAIQVKCRGNTKIYDCTFNEFLTNAVRLTGRAAAGDGAPTTHAEDNYVYNCTFTECGSEVYSAPYYYASAAISLGGQKDAQVYDNTINNNVGNYAYGINSNSQGYNCGLNIHDNTIYTSPRRMDDGQWNFAIELWNNRGGITVKDNYVTGSIDFGGASSDDSQGYGFALLIEGNTVEQPALQAYNQTGIIIESDMTGGVRVIRNKVKNCSTGISLNLLSGPLDVQNDITIAYNLIIETLKTTGNYSGRGINHGTAVSGAVVNRLKIYNNTFYSTSYISSAGVHFASSGVTYNDLEIRNNIFYRQYNAIRFENNTVEGLDATNNLFYLHTNSYSYVSSTVSDSTTIPRVYGNPLFRSAATFRLSDTSPCIDSGTDVSLTTDNYGHKITGTPDIGAMEYGRYIMKIKE